ncbi:MAG: glycosyltransferase family 4 protein [Gammaproteobacteria bacterium]|nr:glycosyltransferase family 4 protein [Gammaproteobacteria bacterium]
MTYCLLKLIARSRFDILHAHWWFPCGLIAGLVARCRPKSRRPRVVVTCHGGDVFALHGLIFDFLLKLTSCTVDRLIAVSASVKRNLVDRAIAADHISIAPMGVDIENLFVPPEDNRSRKASFRRPLVEKKGVDTLLRATAILRDRGVVQQVTIAGDGPLRAHLEDLASELGIREQVRFLGSVPNTKTVAIYQSASLAVFPFRRARSGDQDGLGLVMPEAMGCECCVIASNLENTRDVILDGETGMTFEADDPVALADVLRTVVHDFPHIPDLLRKAGRQHASQLLDWRNVVNNHMRIYSDLCIENGESHG